ncbi:hypothetical protein HAHE_26690 [Haloferula helveola]|uniref:Lipoprotein n=1 Tax=Haloferula helveola TaxID=490095 RepID=A0ABM7RHF7_9BACT|nr:hypothetical protein HAHE_26690 [Haloferula helveola]
MNRLLKFAIPTLCCTILPSCKLLQAPVRVAGGLARGTAQVTEAAFKAPGEAMEKRKQRKEAEERGREARESASRGSGPSLSGSGGDFGGSPSFGSGGATFGDGTPIEGPTSLDPGLPTMPVRPDDAPLVPVGDE